MYTSAHAASKSARASIAAAAFPSSGRLPSASKRARSTACEVIAIAEKRRFHARPLRDPSEYRVRILTEPEALRKVVSLAKDPGEIAPPWMAANRLSTKAIKS